MRTDLIKSLKDESLALSAYRCVICKCFTATAYNLFLTKKKDLLSKENTVSLCDDCYCLFAGNKKKFKKIRLMKKHLHEIINKKRSQNTCTTSNGYKYRIMSKEVRNYIINTDYIQVLHISDADSVESLRYFLSLDRSEDYEKDIDISIFERKSLIINVLNFGMEYKKKKSFYKYFKAGLLDDAIPFYDEIHLPNYSIIKLI